MLTTVVGSYPADSHSPSSWGEKISSFFGSHDPYQRALEIAVHDQVKAGVNIISDGQVRGSMVEVFARSIPGMDYEEGNSRIIGKINPAINSIGASDLKKTIQIAKGLEPNFKSAAELMDGKEFSKGVYGVKGIITGPTTMVLSSRIEGFYRQEERHKAIFDMAVAMKKEALDLQKAGAAYIQVDEPFLSTGMADLKTAYRALEIISKELKIPLAMHVCGDLTNVFSEILKFPVDILDFEFAGNHTNLPLLENADLGRKKIGLGCIDTKTNKVESTEEIHNLINKGMDIVGDKKMIVDPDCGMRMLNRESAMQKLKNMTEAVEWLS
jgi:5-methyltetrahydropteroyltriglutamate--homocysteine methyltransferase